MNSGEVEIELDEPNGANGAGHEDADLDLNKDHATLLSQGKREDPEASRVKRKEREKDKPALRKDAKRRSGDVEKGGAGDVEGAGEGEGLAGGERGGERGGDDGGEGDEGEGRLGLTSDEDESGEDHLAGDPVPHDVLISKVFYFFLSGAYSCVSPFLTVYYDSLGFSETQIGLLFSVQPFLGFVAGSLGTLLADKTHKYKLILASALVLTAALRLTLFGVRDFWPVLAVVFLTESVSSPTYPLLDNAVLEVLRSQAHTYGKVRLWGAVGWGIFAAIMGWIVTFSDLKATFVGFACLVGVTLLILVPFPMGRPHHHDELKHQQRLRARQEDSAAVRMLRLFSSFEVLSFFFTVFTLGFCMGAILSTLFLYLKVLGASELLMGLSITFTCIAEVPFFFFFERLVALLKVRGVLYLSFACYVIRLLYYSFLTNPWLVLPAELLHGITYAAAWSACVLHAKELAPRGLEATMQGLLTGTHWGIGVGVGGLMGGFLYETLGPVNTFRVTAGIATGGLVLFVVSNVISDCLARRKK